jgi:hypothetical protein
VERVTPLIEYDKLHAAIPTPSPELPGISLDVFEIFVDSLKTGANLPGTERNAVLL